MNDAQKRFLTCYKKNFIMMISNLINTFLYPFVSYFFIVHMNWGIRGCAVTDLVSISLTFLISIVYTHTSKDIHKESLVSLDFKSFVSFKE
jgi:Na+-driven multidrug efflux pump